MLRLEEGDTVEELLIHIDNSNHFRIKHAFQGQMVTHPDTITTWDEWVLFVSPLRAKRRRENPNCEEDQKEDAIKRLTCAEQ